MLDDLFGFANFSNVLVSSSLRSLEIHKLTKNFSRHSSSNRSIGSFVVFYNLMVELLTVLNRSKRAHALRKRFSRNLSRNKNMKIT